MSQYIESGRRRGKICNDDAALMLNVSHAKFSFLSHVVTSDFNDFRPLSEMRGGGERFSDVEYCGADEYLYPGLAEKKLFSCTIFANIFIWEAVLLRINS